MWDIAFFKGHVSLFGPSQEQNIKRDLQKKNDLGIQYFINFDHGRSSIPLVMCYQDTVIRNSWI
jgi:hypothetical protein